MKVPLFSIYSFQKPLHWKIRIKCFFCVYGILTDFFLVYDIWGYPSEGPKLSWDTKSVCVKNLMRPISSRYTAGSGALFYPVIFCFVATGGL